MWEAKLFSMWEAYMACKADCRCTKQSAVFSRFPPKHKRAFPAKGVIVCKSHYIQVRLDTTFPSQVQLEGSLRVEASSRSGLPGNPLHYLQIISPAVYLPLHIPSPPSPVLRHT